MEPLPRAGFPLPSPQHYDNVMKTTRRYLAFDIETVRTTEDGTDWKSQRPLGISCAATLLAGSEPILWHGGDLANPNDQMNREEAARLVEYLFKQVANGYTLVTWNGLGFDLDILAEESGMLRVCRELASNHVDLMFHIVCRLGYGVSLNAAAKGMGLAGKPEGMSGAMAPVLWAEGKREEVLRYVAQDARTTLELGFEVRVLRRTAVGCQERAASLHGIAGGLADGGGCFGIATPKYFLDGLALATGEVHGVDGVIGLDAFHGEVGLLRGTEFSGGFSGA